MQECVEVVMPVPICGFSPMFHDSAVLLVVRADPKTHALICAFAAEVLVWGQQRGNLWKCPFWGQQVLFGSIDFQTSLLHPESQPPSRAKQRQEEAEEGL